MTKEQMKATVTDCLNKRYICRAYFKYDINYYYFFPLKINNNLFLSIQEYDFIFDGYSIRRFRDMTKAEIRADFCYDILKSEGLIDAIKVPEIDISTWQSIFTWLKDNNFNAIIEKEDLDNENCEFVIGRVEKIFKHCAYVRHFDADGIWQDETYKIPYNEITSITFDSRYVNMFSKYVDNKYPNKD